MYRREERERERERGRERERERTRVGERERERERERAVAYTHVRAHETGRKRVCRRLREKKNRQSFARKNKNTT